METKRCSKCGKIKENKCFNVNKSKKDGRASVCKSCHKIYRHEHYIKNKEKVLEQIKRWNTLHPDKKYSHIPQTRPCKKAGRTHISLCKNCGKTIYVTSRDIREGNNRYCSRVCYLSFYRKDAIYNYFMSVRKNAKKRGKKFDVSEAYIRELWEKQLGRCAITNIPLVLYNNKEHKKLLNAASLDRIDSIKGYIEGNLQWVSLGVNYMKKNYNQSDLYDLLDLIVINYKRK